jgi:hypothetical protein
VPNPTKHFRLNGSYVLANNAARARHDALRLLGDTIYAARIGCTGAIKIGWTSDLCHRLTCLKHTHQSQVELLAVVVGATRQDEALVHASFGDEHREHGREYYRPTPAVLALVNDWRAEVGLPTLAA